MKDYLSFKEAARFLCVSESKLYKMTHKREVRYYKMGRLNVFKVDDLQNLLNNTVMPTKEQMKENGIKRISEANSKIPQRSSTLT